MQSPRRAALLACALFAFAFVTPWNPAAAAGESAGGTLPGGASYVYQPLAGAQVATIALWFRAPSAGFDEPRVPGLARLAADTVAASRPITGVSLSDFVDGIGGRLTIEVNPEAVGISVLVPAGQAAATVRALTRSYFAPVITDEGVGDAQRIELIDGQLHAASPQGAIQDALYGALFTAGPAKYPTYGTAATIDAADTQRIRAFAERAFRAPNALLVATGAVDRAALADAIPGQAGPAPGREVVSAEHVAMHPAPVVVSGTQAGFGRAWAGPPIVDERDATALDFVADYLFAPPSGALYLAAIATGSAIDGTFLTFHDPGVFLVTATGGDIAAAQTAVTAALASMRRPLAPATFAAARRAFVYRTLSNAQSADGLADSYGWYGIEGNIAYAPGVDGTSGRYLADAAALTPQSVAATVVRYLGSGGAVVSVTPTERNPAAPPAAISAAPNPYVQAIPGTQLVEMQVVVAAGTARETRAQNGLAALSAQAIVHTTIDGMPLVDRVAAMGGSISYAVAPDVVRFTVEALPAAVPVIVQDLTTAFVMPDVSPSAIDSARTSLDRRIEQAAADPVDAGLEMLSGSYYEGSAALPAYGTQAAIATLQPDDVAAFIAEHYIRANTFVTELGDVDSSSAQAARAALEQLPPGDDPAPAVTVEAPSAPGKRIIAKRDIGVPVVLLGFAAPSAGDRDFAPMLMLSAMLEDLGGQNAIALLSGAGPSLAVVYRFDAKPAMLTVVLNGGVVNLSTIVAAVGDAAKRAAEQPLDAAALDRLRAQARGQWLLGTANLADRAWLVGTDIATGTDASPESVASAIDRVTASDIQRVAAAFLQHYNEAIVTPLTAPAQAKS